MTKGVANAIQQIIHYGLFATRSLLRRSNLNDTQNPDVDCIDHGVEGEGKLRSTPEYEERSHGRASQGSDIAGQCIERNGTRKICGRHQARHEAKEGGLAECDDRTMREGETHQQRRGNVIREHQDGQHGRLRQSGYLGDDQHLVTIETVGQNASERTKEKRWNQIRKSHDAQPRWRLCQDPGQPSHGYALDCESNPGCRPSNDEDAVTALCKRRTNSTQEAREPGIARSWTRGGWRRHGGVPSE